MSKTHHELRELFLSYFEENGHRRVPSSSLIPQADPTLLFTNAGMNQFKRVFLGEEKRPYLRAVSCQKCMRAGGKHNDLEQVGYTARHHTFFEMLGNFSFGDYFKEEAIAFAFEFLTERIHLDPGRIWVTVFREDESARKIWQATGIPGDRILSGDEADNFWAMGETGPCGPCSEIYYDQGPDPAWNCPNPPACNPFCSCDRFLELWNLVFMQYNRTPEGKLLDLPHPSIDTGMGLERFCAVVQGVKSNFDTDLFAPLREQLESLTGLTYHKDPETDRAFRVLMDHARAIAFLIADGVLPGNEGRGYVLRRIMRRAIRYASKLEENRSLLLPLCHTVSDSMGGIYPELKRNEKTIEEVVALEEERFRETLGRGLRLFQKTVSHLREKKEGVIPGEVAFRLYDTYGFPRDLIELLAREEGMAVDEVGFESAMRVQKEGGRLARKKTLDVEEIPSYLQHLPPTTFTGYESQEGKGRVLAVGKENQELQEGEEGVIVLDRTPFYAEGGGQVADRGTMEGKGILLKVLDVKKTPEGIFLHRVRVEKGGVVPGEELDLKVDPQHRLGAEIHHTATHMLQAALREILGVHVRQAGSLVEPHRLRFDFTHYQPLTLEQWRRVEERVNEKIREGIEVRTEVMDYDTAIARGALAFFGDKYGEIVRVVEIPGFSIELCGGTHVSQTGNLGLWVIRAESGVASGVRRIEALAGPFALRYLHELEDRLKGVAERVGAPLSSLEKRLEELLKEKEALQKALKESRELEIKKKIPQLLSRVKEIQGFRVLTQLLEGMSMEDLQSLSDELRKQIPDLYLLLAGIQGGKGILFLSLPEGSPFHAGKIIQEIAPLCGARGGGGPRSAQAGGARSSDLARAFEHFSELLNTRKELRHA